MGNKILLILLVATLHVDSSLAYSNSNSCTSLFQFKEDFTPQIFSPSSKIATPESLEAVHYMLNEINRFISIAKSGDGYTSRIYAKHLSEILRTQSLGRQIIEAKADDQNVVYEFMKQSSVWAEILPSFAKQFAHQKRMAHIQTYNESSFVKLVGHRSDASMTFEQFLSDFSKNTIDYINDQNHDPGLSIFRESEHNFQSPIFRYKYIFKVGLIPIEEFLKVRETGIVFVSVTTKIEIEYDGNRTGPLKFFDHDLGHALFQTQRDHDLFKNFKASTLTEQRNIKIKTNALLQKRLREIELMSDKDLKDAIYGALFSLFHERAGSYPFIFDDMNNTKNFSWYMARIVDDIKSAPELSHLSNSKIKEGIVWVVKNGTADLKELKTTFDQN